MKVSNLESFEYFDAVPDFVMALTENGEVINLNDASKQIIGRTKTSLGKIFIDDVFYFQERPSDFLKCLTAIKETARTALTMKTSKGHIEVDSFISRAVMKGQKIFMITARPAITDNTEASDLIFEKETVFLSRIFQVSGIIFLITDRKGSIINANHACENISGYPVEKLKGLNIFDTFIPYDETDIARAKLNALSDRCRSNTSVNSWKTGNGESRLISWTNTLYIKKTGHEYIVSAGIDITEQKKAEALLKKTEERLSLALEASSHGLWDVNLEKMEVYFSPSYYRMLGYDPENFRFSVDSWRAEINPYDLPLIDRFFTGKLIKLEEPFEVEFRMRTKEGVWKWFLAWGRSVETDRKGSPIRLSGIFTDFSQRKKVEESLRVNEARLRAENIRLRGSIKERFRFGSIIGKSPAMQKVYEVIMQAAGSSAPVIIYGESGTGKELVARAIHDTSERSRCPFVVVNCGAIPENLIESEFFGYRKGAFSGAVRDNPGFIEQADQGSLFLDEIGEIGLGMQVKLLRAIEGGGYTPIGSNETKHSNFRIIAATNRNLADLVRQGKMRHDFFYRIHVVPVNLPPLRERMDDLPLLVQHFCEIFKAGSSELFPDQIISAMKKYSWPGNVRELQNAVHRYITLKSFDIPEIGITGDVKSGGFDFMSMFSGNTFRDAAKKFEKLFIKGVLDMHSGNRTHASKYLDIERRTLLKKLKELGID